MSQALARPVTNNKPEHTLVIQDIGAFTLHPLNDQQVQVSSKDGVLVNGIVYPFSGLVIKHTDGWRFWAPSLEIPKLSPKQKQEAIERLSVQVNVYIEAHPELMDQIAIRTWEQQLGSLRYFLRQQQASLVRTQAAIEEQQRTLAASQERLTTMQQELEVHLAKRPEGAVDPNEQENVAS